MLCFCLPCMNIMQYVSCASYAFYTSSSMPQKPQMPIPNDMLEVNRMPVRTSMTMFNLNPIELLVVHLKNFQDPDGGSRCVRKDEQRCTLLHRSKHRVQWLGKSWVRLPKPFLLEPTLEQILSNQSWIQRGCALFFLKDFALRMSLWNDYELPSLQSHQKRWSLKTHHKINDI